MHVNAFIAEHLEETIPGLVAEPFTATRRAQTAVLRGITKGLGVAGISTEEAWSVLMRSGGNTVAAQDLATRAMERLGADRKPGAAIAQRALERSMAAPLVAVQTMLHRGDWSVGEQAERGRLAGAKAGEHISRVVSAIGALGGPHHTTAVGNLRREVRQGVPSLDHAGQRPVAPQPPGHRGWAVVSI